LDFPLREDTSVHGGPRVFKMSPWCCVVVVVVVVWVTTMLRDRSCCSTSTVGRGMVQNVTVVLCWRGGCGGVGDNHAQGQVLLLHFHGRKGHGSKGHRVMDVVVVVVVVV
jgi:hypothetical protein